jgi:hypothetical protein
VKVRDPQTPDDVQHGMHKNPHDGQEDALQPLVEPPELLPEIPLELLPEVPEVPEHAPD